MWGGARKPEKKKPKVLGLGCGDDTVIKKGERLPPMGNKVSLDEQIFNLRFQSKQLERRYEKYEKESRKKKKKVKEYLAKGNKEMAREYAQQAITQHQSGMTFLKLASKLDAVRSRMESAKASKQMVPMMSKTVASMDTALQQMDVVKITSTMDKFEEQFGELDVRTGYMNQAMGSATAAMTPEDEIDSLMQQVADEHGLSMANAIDAAGAVPNGIAAPEQESAQTEAQAEAAME